MGGVIHLLLSRAAANAFGLIYPLLVGAKNYEERGCYSNTNNGVEKDL